MIDSSTLRDLIDIAYPNFQERTKGGGRLLDDVYTIQALVPHGTSQDQIAHMMGNLLSERFGLLFHEEWARFPAYALVVAPGGLHLRYIQEPETDPKTGQPLYRIPLSDGTEFRMRRLDDSTDRIQFRHRPLSSLAMAIRVCGDAAPIINQTGVDGTFDFTFDIPSDCRHRGVAVAPPPQEPDDADQPEDFIARTSAELQKQLGLRLAPVKIDRKVMVIDHLEKLRPE
jgi:uncharacterized protein (TIGR03435 family)